MHRCSRTVRFGLIGLLVYSTSVRSDEPAATSAKERLQGLIAAYRALPAYADHGEVTLVVKVGDRLIKQTQKASVAFGRPQLLDVQTEIVRVISDGTNLTELVAPLKKYRTIPVPRKFAESTLRGGPLGAIEFGGLTGLPLVHVLNLVIGDDPERLIQDFSPNLMVEPDLIVEGTAYRVLRLDESDNHDWRFLIDPKSGLIAFIDLVIEGNATKGSIVGGETHVESLRWSAGPISTEPRPAETFQFQPPAGFTQVIKLEVSARFPGAVDQASSIVSRLVPRPR